jgi:hypothetical protein
LLHCPRRAQIYKTHGIKKKLASASPTAADSSRASEGQY